ncbi:MAG: ABC transporter permease [Bacteriovoracales bacterium]|nr:ABC transporter permease [Bacteriovoracales bacterium]
MNAVENKSRLLAAPKSLWAEAFFRLSKDKLAMVALTIVGFYLLMALLSWGGAIASDWNAEVGPSYGAPSKDFILGTDIFGRSIFKKVIKGTQTAVSVGFVSAVLAGLIGVFLGSMAGYFRGWVDDFVVWLYTVFTSIPYIMLIISIAFVLGKGILSVYLALGLTSWVGLCRIVRAEVIRHREREYVQAAQAIGGGMGANWSNISSPTSFMWSSSTFPSSFRWPSRPR